MEIVSCHNYNTREINILQSYKISWKKDIRKEVALVLTSGVIPREAMCLQFTSVSV